MGSGVLQTIRKADFLHSSHKRISTLTTKNKTSGGVLCMSGRTTFVPVCWMCKQQTSVSHSSAESEILSLDAGLQMDGVPALDLWDMVIEVVRSTINTVKPKNTSIQETGAILDSKTKTQRVKRRQKIEKLSEVD